MPNYGDFTDRELVKVLCEHAGDFDPDTAATLSKADDFLDDAREKDAEIIGTGDAIAVVRPHGGSSDYPVLWLLWVDPNVRGKGVGRNFVARLRRNYETNLPMVLMCHGSQRERFFASCGFETTSRSNATDTITMTGRLG